MKEASLLQPLPIPKRPWSSVSMDIISGFSKVDENASIMVVVDRFPKYFIFIFTPVTCSSEVGAGLLCKNLVRLFRLFSDIMSDQDVRFIGRLWKTFLT